MADVKLPVTEPQFGAYVVLPGDDGHMGKPQP
jgi:hypothetical protein